VVVAVVAAVLVVLKGMQTNSMPQVVVVPDR
jgi:hypothetical protein